MAVDTSKPAANELSQRECEILSLVAKGASNKEIAHDLHISTNTVKVHLRNIFTKVGASSRTEAAMYAVNAGLVDVRSAEPGSDQEPAEQSRVPRVYFGLGIAGVVLISLLLAFLAFQGFFSRGQEPANQPVIPVEEGWQEKSALEEPRKGLALASYDDQIYALAGESVAGITASVESYDPVSDQWTARKDKPIPVTDISAAAIAGKIYVPGGLTSSGELSKKLEIYSPIEDRWERGTDLPLGLSAYALAAYEGNLYLFGGWDGEEYLNTVFQYDPELDLWQAMSPMKYARGYAGAAVSGGKIFVVGGYDGRSGLASVEVYVPELEGSQIGPWSEGVDLPSGRYGMGVAGLGNMIHVVGGEIDGSESQGSLVFSPQDGIWQEFDSPALDSISNPGLIPWETHLYLVGGEIGAELSPKNIAYQAIYTFVMPIIR